MPFALLCVFALIGSKQIHNYVILKLLASRIRCRRISGSGMKAFAIAIFLGSFLLFQVQPLIAKYILPWFGGGPGVWAVCLLFFQILLLAGYAYAHGLTRLSSQRTQAVIHAALLAIALAFLPIIPGAQWKPV